MCLVRFVSNFIFQRILKSGQRKESLYVLFLFQSMLTIRYFQIEGAQELVSWWCVQNKMQSRYCRRCLGHKPVSGMKNWRAYDPLGCNDDMFTFRFCQLETYLPILWSILMSIHQPVILHWKIVYIPILFASLSSCVLHPRLCSIKPFVNIFWNIFYYQNKFYEAIM